MGIFFGLDWVQGCRGVPTSKRKWHIDLCLTVSFYCSALIVLGFFHYLAMAEIHSCQNLSNFHIVIWWGDRGPVLVAWELKSYVDHCPPSLKETVLKGVIVYNSFYR